MWFAWYPTVEALQSSLTRIRRFLNSQIECGVPTKSTMMTHGNMPNMKMIQWNSVCSTLQNRA